MKLARQLHPDKSKSDSCAELFKLVVHAHSILTDEETKRKYDTQLVMRGLGAYDPHTHRASTTKVKTDHVKKQSPTKTYHRRKNKPYEEQPYGFGINGGSSDENNDGGDVPKFKSFNLKSYQRKKHGNGIPPQKPETKDNNGKEPTVEKEFESSKESGKFNAKNKRKNKVIIEEVEDNSLKEQAKRKEDVRDTNEVGGSTSHKETTNESVKTEQKKKLRKIEHDSDKESSTAFINTERRHSARSKIAKQNARRRSLSPFKDLPKSAFDMTDSLKKLIEKFNDEVEREANAYDIGELSLDEIGEGGSVSKRRKPNERSKSPFDMTMVDNVLNSIQDSNKERSHYINDKKSSSNFESFLLDIRDLKLPNMTIDLNNDTVDTAALRLQVEQFYSECENLKGILFVNFSNLGTMDDSRHLNDPDMMNRLVQNQTLQLTIIKKLNELQYKQSKVLYEYQNILYKVKNNHT